MKLKIWIKNLEVGIKKRVWKMMKCIRSGELLRVDEMAASSESLATRDYSASGFSSRANELDSKVDNSNIEEAETSLRESGYLNYEEARALLGRLEYQKGNIDSALHVFEGIDIASVIPKMKASLSRRREQNRRHSQSDPAPPMSMHAISLLLEAIFLKTKSLQCLGRFKEAAESCKVILDTVESGLPEGLPGNLLTDCKLQEILNRAVELLPELWILAEAPHEAILSYRRALLYHWNLEVETKSKIEKAFAVFLLYSGTDASPPNLRSQMEGSFVPRNNIEEAVLLLLILLRKITQKRIEWDPTVIDHLTFALSVSGELKALAHQIEELHPGALDRRVRYCTLALCYHGEGEDMVALNLLRNLFNHRENHNHSIVEFILASKICVENSVYLEEGIAYASKAAAELKPDLCVQIASVAHCLVGRLLSAQSRLVASDSERASKQHEALERLETSENLMRERDPNVLFHLSLENADQRKLDVALHYAKQLLALEAGSSLKSYVLLSRILSSQKRFLDAEAVINAAIDQTGKWDHGELLRTKAKLQIAQGQLKSAIQSYSHLLAVLQVRSKTFSAVKKLVKNKRNLDKSLEVETWHDLAKVYTSLSQWRDAEVCLLKSKAISPYSASRWHTTGLLYEEKGMKQEALKAYRAALDVEPTHVPSLISTASVLRRLNSESMPIIRSFLIDALRLDKMNHSAWYNLGLLNNVDPNSSAEEAAECFEAASHLEETAPVEPFR